MAKVFLVAAGLLLGSIAFVHWVGLIVQDSMHMLASQRSVIEELDQSLSALKDAETGQRGYLLSGQEQYLAPYKQALVEVRTHLDGLGHLVSTGDLPGKAVDRVAALTHEKLAELEQTVQLRREQGLEAALAIVRSDQSQRIMDSIRAETAEMRAEEESQYHEAGRRAERATTLRTVAFISIALLNLGFLAWAYRRISRDITERNRVEQERQRLARELADHVAELQAVLDAAPVAVWIAHDPQCLRMTGNAFADQIIMRVPRGGNISRSALPQEATVSHKVYRNGVELRPEQLPAQVAAATGKSVSDEEFDLVFSDGRTVRLFMGAVPLFDAAGRVRGAVAAGADITQRKQAEESLRDSERRVRLKLDSILSPDGDLGTLELGDILDAPALQRLMDNFYELAHIPMSIMDLKGKMLVGVGWQDICTQFHRVHPETCKHCVESDTLLTAGVARGEFHLYKCKNHMWDMATPIVVGGRHVGNLFMGQFFFEDEELPYELFRSQAERYGFPTEAYLAALERVPRLDRKAVEIAVAFFLQLSQTLSQLSYSNVRLARSLTEREVLTASLRNSEQHLSRAQEIARLGSWELDLVRNRLSWSDEVYRIFGLQPQEFAATYEAFLEAVHPEDRAAVDAAYSDSLHEGRDTYEIEHRVVRKADGQIRIVHEKCEHIRDESGQIIRSVGMVHDITERKKREQDLRQLNRTLKALSSSDQAMLRATEEADYVEEVCRIIVEECGHTMVWVGYAEQDEDKTVHPVAQAGFDGGYLDSLKITWADSQRGRGPTGMAIRTGKPCMCRNMLADPAFEPWRAEAIKRGYVSSIALPLMADDQAFGALTIYARDPDPFSEDEVRLLSDLASDLAYGITAIRLRLAHARAEQELHQAAEQHRLALEAADLGAWDYRFDTGEVFWDARCRDLFGVPAGNRIEYNTAISKIHEEDRPDVDQAVQQAIAGTNGGAYHREYRVVWLDGSIHWVASHGRVYFNEDETDPRAVRFVGVNMDITRRKQAEESLRRLSEDLKRSNEDLEQFAYVASHDLQEPLRMVAGYLQLIERRYKEKLDEAGREFIDFAVDGATRMSRLITDLLDYSRINTRGKPSTPVNTGLILERATRNLSTAIAESGAAITHDPLPTVQGDGTQLLQLFQNLIGNAIKFRSPDRSCRIHVGARHKDDHWVFCIRDNGIGIDSQYAERIFLIFQRLHNRKQYPGTGIGLAICKRIVERHGGRIWVEGSLGEGCTFHFTLGAQQPDRAQPRDEAASSDK